MAKRTFNRTIGLDIGTSRVTCIAGEPGDGGLLNIVGIGRRKYRPAQGCNCESGCCC